MLILNFSAFWSWSGNCLQSTVWGALNAQVSPQRQWMYLKKNVHCSTVLNIKNFKVTIIGENKHGSNTMNYNIAIKMNRLDLHILTWINLETKRLSEQKNVSRICFVWCHLHKFQKHSKQHYIKVWGIWTYLLRLWKGDYTSTSG